MKNGVYFFYKIRYLKKVRSGYKIKFKFKKLQMALSKFSQLKKLFSEGILTHQRQTVTYFNQ